MNVQLPDGTTLEDVPEGTTKIQLLSKLKQNGYDIQPLLMAERGNVDPTEGMSGPQRFAAGMGKAVVDLGRGAGQMLGMVSDEDIAESRKLDAPLMKTEGGKWGNVAGNVASAIPAAVIPGVNTLAGAAALGSTMGALQPTVEGESRLENTGTGALFGAGGYGAGKLLGAAVRGAGSKIGGIEAKVSAKAADQAAGETASARSAAGNAAQNAYRQLEHLRELKALRGLSPEETQVVKELSAELAQKAQEKLIPAAAMKKAAAQAYQDAIAGESGRAAQLAAEKLGGAEVKRQVMARLMRYGPAAAGGVIGNMIFPGLGGSVGGAATGLVLRPALRSMINLSKNPAVQRSLLSPVANAKLLANPQLPRALGIAAPGFAFGGADPEMMAQALRNQSQ